MPRGWGKVRRQTLNCPEEVYLAEKLIGLHPWADMARFTSGRAISIAENQRQLEMDAAEARAIYFGQVYR